MTHRFLIVGAGFSGCVLANQLATQMDCTIEIWDERNHLGGNCHTERDETTGIMLHQYGPHIFNTDKKEIWDFVNRFSEFRPYVHRVKAMSNGKLYPMPVNLNTINQYFNKNFDAAEAKKFLESQADKTITNPKNFEEQALAFLGRDLYKAFFYGYTKKQWGCEPAELPASILKRIPIRFNTDENYHLNIYTGIPVAGYTEVMKKMINRPEISVLLNKKFISSADHTDYDHIFFTGPIDAYFNYEYGRLGYRTVRFEKSYAEGDFQGHTQVNFCDENIPFTRITEHKHFTPWESHQQTVYFTEYSKETEPNDTPYYPKRLPADELLIKQYRLAAEKLQQISFLGRLATYRYMDMHHVIAEALIFSKNFSESVKNNHTRPVFPNSEKE